MNGRIPGYKKESKKVSGLIGSSESREGKEPIHKKKDTKGPEEHMTMTNQNFQLKEDTHFQ